MFKDEVLLEMFHVLGALLASTTPCPAGQSLSENCEGLCFCAKGWMARRDEGEYPWWIFD
jgi:hypothetical protein